ncbi:MAG: signal recognition particle protein Srp54 [Candidatus Methanoperedens sp.]|nr:signal recognition particle protein Srp54 [Candidatus Methanoperedens sp.]MCZ7370124.1 signal recognition particle protein Srp54 [Candidatus Methanoperedens sp.]
MVLDKLGDSLQGALKKLVGAGRIDEKIVDEAVKDIQRALLQADVNVRLVMTLSQKIKQRSLKEEPPSGMNPREHVIRIVYQELINILGKTSNVKLAPQTIMMVGLQGSGKTTTTAKLARYFQRKGLRTAVVCADTFRPGAYDQLKTLCDRMGIFFYGEKDVKDAIAITQRGLKAIEKFDVKIIDTAGRHALEKDLIKEMEEIHNIAKPDHKLLVIDAAMGQLASDQAAAFNKSIGITGVVITKLDGTAKGGGAMSAVSETDSAIAFIGIGETSEDLEKFEADRFISRLLGMGDIKSLIERAEETLKSEDLDVEKMLKGRFTLMDMYKQMEAVNKMGPLKQVMQMLPMGKLGVNVTEDMYNVTQEKMKRYKYIMDSMTDKELEEPKHINSSRIIRIARGSGTKYEEVRELLKYHKTMQKALRGMMGNKFNLQKMMKKFGM